ncbi:MAG: MOSC domain-containing protein [Deltaproteobacteria bacterium]|nr:MOSC domain-containing protein [Deltaproteobacteria bacterium]
MYRRVGLRTQKEAGAVLAVCTSRKKGTVKHRVAAILLRKDHGVFGDAHAGPGDRQVSLLEDEKIELMRQKGLALKPGAFGENVVTSGIGLSSVKLGTVIRIGKRVELQVTVIGKECHTRCAIFYRTGECIMPVFGVFTRVLRGGAVRKGDRVALLVRGTRA